ncbi:MAG: hypothetical protein V1918_07595, partial [Planctomycetota bacterium]
MRFLRWLPGFLLALASGLSPFLFSGCETETLYGRPFLLEADGRLYLTVQTGIPGGTGQEFLLLTSADPSYRHWTSPERMRGQVAGLVPAEQGLRIVFSTGTVFDFQYKEGATHRRTSLFGSQAFLAASGTPESTVALAFENGKFQLYTLVPKETVLPPPPETAK